MIHYYVKPAQRGLWLVVYKSLRKDPYSNNYHEVETVAGDTLSYEAADQLRKQLHQEAKDRDNKMHAELKALDRSYRGQI